MSEQPKAIAFAWPFEPRLEAPESEGDFCATYCQQVSSLLKSGDISLPGAIRLLREFAESQEAKRHPSELARAVALIPFLESRKDAVI